MPMSPALESSELIALLRRVFAPRATDRGLALITDLPDDRLADDDAWSERRRLVAEWADQLRAAHDLAPDDGSEALGLDIALFAYRHVGTNNGDLPADAWPIDQGGPPDHADTLIGQPTLAFEELFRRFDLIVAPTHFSTTAPLKLAARRYGFRAATMPGFRSSMIPALRLDYGEIDRRVRLLARRLDEAEGADFEFRVGDQVFALHLDLRHRRAHASGGLVHEPGQAGNLPSGESYIVPYEGEIEGDPSRSEGRLPVELDGEVVVYRIDGNRAVEVLGDGPVARREARQLSREPAYGNLAELGLGVLADFGVEPIGEILLDEKLGLHIAFGRSDHFGGQVGAAQFSGPAAVVHIDRVYLPACQPQIAVPRVDLTLGGGATVPLMRDGRYVIDF